MLQVSNFSILALIKFVYAFVILVTLSSKGAQATGKDIYIVPTFDFGVTPNRYLTIDNPYGLYYQTGLGVTWMFSNHFGVTSGGGYSYYKYVADGDHHYRDQQTATYIEVPLAAYLEAGNGSGRNVWFWAKAGMSLAFNRSAEYWYTLNRIANTTEHKTVDNKNERNRFSLKLSGAWVFAENCQNLPT